MPFCVHLQHHELNPPSFLDGCRYLVVVLSFSVIRVFPEAFSLSIELLVSHSPSLPVPQSSLLGPFARLGSATPLQLPCLTFPCSSISVVGLILFCCFNPYLLPLHQMTPACLNVSAFLPPFCPIAVSFPGRCFLRFLGFMD